MYTMLWTENGNKHWDRFKTFKEVKDKLEKIRGDPNACSLKDVWVFHPEADDYTEVGSDIIHQFKI